MKTTSAILSSLALIACLDTPAAEPATARATEPSASVANSTNVLLVYGSGYKVEVPKAKIEALPDWSPASDTIPLLPQQAAQLALARYRALHPLATNVETRNILLHRISCAGSKWAYQVHVDAPNTPRRPEEPRAREFSTVVVLLDGTVVDPVVDPDASLVGRNRADELDSALPLWILRTGVFCFSAAR